MVRVSLWLTYNETDIPIVDAAIPKTINDTDVVSLLRGSFLVPSNGMDFPGVWLGMGILVCAIRPWSGTTCFHHQPEWDWVRRAGMAWLYGEYFVFPFPLKFFFSFSTRLDVFLSRSSQIGSRQTLHAGGAIRYAIGMSLVSNSPVFGWIWMKLVRFVMEVGE